MEIIKRITEMKEKETVTIKRMGINNLGVFSIIFNDVDDREWLINFSPEELKKLKEFLDRWE